MALLVALEGLNGVGKSTTVEKLRTDFDISTTRTPVPEHMEARKVFEDDPFSLAACLFNLASVALVTNRVKDSSAKFIVVDRYVASTRSYAAAAGVEIEGLLSVLQYSADFTILLSCDESVRQARLAQRDRRSIDEATRSSLFASKVLASLAADQPSVTIDTSASDPDAVARECVTAISTWLKRVGEFTSY